MVRIQYGSPNAASGSQRHHVIVHWAVSFRRSACDSLGRSVWQVRRAREPGAR
jgi:hypothetical protein